MLLAHGFSGTFDVEDIDPFVCTHMMYGFAGLNNETLTIQPLDEYNDLYDNWGKGAYDRYILYKLEQLLCKASIGSQE